MLTPLRLIGDGLDGCAHFRIDSAAPGVHSWRAAAFAVLVLAESRLLAWYAFSFGVRHPTCRPVLKLAAP
jgi:hypothetical protein